MKGSVVKIERKWDSEGYGSTEVTFVIGNLMQPWRPDKPDWNEPSENSSEDYKENYKQVMERYIQEMAKYQKEVEVYNKAWDEINRLHLGKALLVQNEVEE